MYHMYMYNYVKHTFCGDLMYNYKVHLTSVVRLLTMLLIRFVVVSMLEVLMLLVSGRASLACMATRETTAHSSKGC